MSTAKLPERTLQVGDRLNGFTIERVTDLTDVHSVAYEAKHDETGARVLHLHTDDPENLFSIGFRTPPEDSTGVPHIIEHSVLSGSERFPVKDAFNELSSGSLCTFLNAMTWPDRTVYPAASAVRADYFNLATVYLDVALRPRLSESTFLQEGHHLEFEDSEDSDSPLTISGVVYNEMKGSYSSVDDVVFKQLQEALFPDNCYGVDSGGDPAVIPDLTYEGFKEFHRRFYSLSNARLFLYGNITTADQLAFLEVEFGRQASLEALEVDSAVQSQPTWDRPRRSEGLFPVAKGESLSGKSVVNVAWMTSDITVPEDTIPLLVLHKALVGSAAGPLRVALLESGLGDAISAESAFEKDFRQVPFVVGLRGTEEERAEEIEALVIGTLERLAEEGIDEELLRGAFQEFEFASKEISSAYPVHLMMRAFETWNYDADPRTGLNLSSAVETVRTRWASDPELFQKAIRRWLLENTHRLLSISTPSETVAEEKQSAFERGMAERKESLSASELESIGEKAAALRIAQETPDTPEALATLPRVTVADIPHEMQRTPTRETELGGVRVLEHELFTGGIVYIGLSFDVAPVENDQQPLLPLIGRLTTGMGAAGLAYDEMAKRKALHTGGISCGVSASQRLRAGGCEQRMTFLGRALTREAGELGQIMRDLLCAGDLEDTKRAQDLLLEMRSNARASIVDEGHRHAILLAGAAQDLTGFRNEQYSGYTQLSFLDRCTKALDTDPSEILRQVGEERSRIFTRSRLVANLTGDAQGLAAAREALGELIGALPVGGAAEASTPETLGADRVGFALSSEVSFVVRSAPVPGMLDPIAPKLDVLGRILADGYLYENIRVKGGAYGGFCFYNPLQGEFVMASYRDPNLVKTMEVFDGIIAAARREGTIDEQIVEKAVIGSVGSFDGIVDPCRKGQSALRRSLIDVRDEDRERYREGLLAVDLRAVLDEALPVLEAGLRSATQAVVSSRPKIEEANESLTSAFEIRSLD